MASTCVVSGQMVGPDGAPVTGVAVTWIRAPEVVAPAPGGGVAPERVTVTTDTAGNLSVDLVAGRYFVEVALSSGRRIRPTAATVPNAPTASLQSVLEATGPVAPGLSGGLVRDLLSWLSGDERLHASAIAGLGSGGGPIGIRDVAGVQAALDGKAPTAHGHVAADIMDSSAAGRALLTAAGAVEQRAALAVESSAELDARDAANRSRANHTGLQAASTISDLSDALRGTLLAGFAAAPARVAVSATDSILSALGKVQRWLDDLASVAFSGSASDLTSGILPAARFDDIAHGSRAGGTLHATATPGAAGFMSAADKTKLDGIAAGANSYAHPNHTGDVISSGDGATTIAPDAVGNDKLANMASGTIKGRTGAGTGDPEDLTGTQVTALLDTFTSGAKGLAPASGGGTTNFLRADGTWAAPPGGGSPGGASGEIQFNNAGAFGGAADVEIEGGQLRLPTIATPATPAADGLKLFGRKVGGRAMPAFMAPAGRASVLQPVLWHNRVAMWQATGNGGTDTSFGIAVTAAGTANSDVVGTANLYTYMRRRSWRVTTASTTAVAGLRANSLQWTLGGPADGLGGFYLSWIWGPATGVATPTTRAFVGMRGPVAAPTDVNPSTLTNICGMGWDSGDANIQFMHNDGSGTATKIDLGTSFPRPNVDLTSVYEVALFARPGTTQILEYAVTDLVSGATATGTITTDIPSAAQFLASNGYISVGGTSSVIGFATMHLYIESDF